MQLLPKLRRRKEIYEIIINLEDIIRVVKRYEICLCVRLKFENISQKVFVFQYEEHCLNETFSPKFFKYIFSA